MNSNVGYVPKTDDEFLLDTALARTAVEEAILRHAGYLKEVPGYNEMVKVQYGKDLQDIKAVIGTGGVFHYGNNPLEILKGVQYQPKNLASLKPINPDYYVDSGYVMYGMGLLSEHYPTQALRIMKKSLKNLATSIKN